jgi:hypothetical protein
LNEVEDSKEFVIACKTCVFDLCCYLHQKRGCGLDAGQRKAIAFRERKNNFDFCICFLPNLCYGVYIPVKDAVELAALELEVSCVTGLPARTARPFVPSFFVPANPLRILGPSALPRIGSF